MQKEAPRVSSGNNYSGVTALIFGILSVVFALAVLVGSFAGIIFGVIGIFFALSQRKHNPNKWANWGLTLSIIGILINLTVLYFLFAAITELVRQVQELQSTGLLDQSQLAQ